MSPEMGTLLMFGLMLVLLAAGVHMVFVLGAVALISSLIFLGPTGLLIATGKIRDVWANPSLLALPLFVFMASVLERSGIAEAGYEMIYRWSGGVRGGLASGTVLLCTIFAATIGIGSVATVAMGMIAIPIMFNHKYDKGITLGSVMAGSVLGIVIPPSVCMILYGLCTRVSIGRLFFGGVFPGLVVAALIIAYITIRCYFQPHLAPSLPTKQRVSFKEKIVSLRSLALPIILIILVLGSIYLGIATPSEAGSVGAVGALICAAIHRRLNWKMLRESSTTTFKLLGMGGWILAAAMLFNGVYMATGARGLLESIIFGAEMNRWFIIIMFNLVIFIAGMFMDDFAIIVLFGPMFNSIAIGLGFDPLWWGIVFILNIQMAYLTPPYGFNLFYMRALIPQIKDKFPKDLEITLGDIYRSVIPFVGLQLAGLIIVMVFPQLATWLPGTMMKK